MHLSCMHVVHACLCARLCAHICCSCVSARTCVCAWWGPVLDCSLPPCPVGKAGPRSVGLPPEPPPLSLASSALSSCCPQPEAERKTFLSNPSCQVGRALVGCQVLSPTQGRGEAQGHLG